MRRLSNLMVGLPQEMLERSRSDRSSRNTKRCWTQGAAPGVEKLLNLWVSQDDAALAQLVVEYGGESAASQLVAKMASVPVPDVPARATTVVDTLRERPDELPSVVIALANWVLAVVPIATIGRLAEALEAIEALGIDTAPDE